MAPKLKAFIDTTNDVLRQSRRFVSVSCPENLKSTGHAIELSAPKKRFAISRQVGATLYRLPIAALVSGVGGWGTSSPQARKP